MANQCRPRIRWERADEIATLRSFASTVARRILVSDGWKACSIEKSQVFQDLAYMMMEALRSEHAGAR